MEDRGEACVLLSCAAGETWAVPQAALAAVVHRAQADHASALQWQDRVVPVLNRAESGEAAFPGPAAGELLAVFRGGHGGPVPFWALRLVPPGARWVTLREADIEGAPEAAMPGVLAAFHHAGTLCQVPDLSSMESRLPGVPKDEK